jgi:hypothetical protein
VKLRAAPYRDVWVRATVLWLVLATLLAGCARGAAAGAGASRLLRAGTGDAVQVAPYGYGVANWYLYNGDRHTAATLFHRILEGPNWAAFGIIAAEAELAGGAR